MSNEEAEQFMEWVKARAPQPKREWVGLTMDEIEYIFEKFGLDDAYFRALVKDIEEKLREKNNG
jgi:hypothetical protein